MVQRKVANKAGIKPHLHRTDTQLVNLKPSSSPPSSSSQTHDKLKKIMKKSRSIKRSDESRQMPTKKTPPSTPEKQAEHLQRGSFTNTPNASPFKRSPNYMKSTSSFEARKEQSPSPTTPTKKGSKTNESSSSGTKGSRTTSLKVRTLTKTPSFKPLRSSKKVIISEAVDSQRATCSSTLKDSKFPNNLQLNDGGTELDGTSAMRVCPYTYCSLNGHHHAPVPPLKRFLSARRRVLKMQKGGFKRGCLSPRQTKPAVKKDPVKEPVRVTPEKVDVEDPDFFIDIYYSSDERVQSLVEMEDKNEYIKPKSTEEVDMKNKDIFIDIYGDDREQDNNVCITPKMVAPGTCGSFIHQVYSDEREKKGGQDSECSEIEWEEGYCCDSDRFKSEEMDGGVAEDQMGVERLYKKYQESYDEESVSSCVWSEEDGDSASDSWCQHLKINKNYMKFDESEVSTTTCESEMYDKMDQDQNQLEQTSEEPKPVPECADKSNNDEDKKNHTTTLIYNIIQLNIYVFMNGEKTTEHSVQVPVATSVSADKMGTEESMEQQYTSHEDNEASEVDAELLLDGQDLEQSYANEKQEQECNQEPEVRSDDIISETNGKKSASVDELSDPCENHRDLKGSKKPGEETIDDSLEFNPRGPNFLPDTPDPDAETVDLRHQEIDERKNAEEFMVDFALQQAVTTLAPARKRKVALLVEAFEKVMPDPVPVQGPVRIPGYEPHNRHTSKAFTNSRPIQACS